MGLTGEIETDDLPNDYAKMCFQKWCSKGLDPTEFARAMLCFSANVLMKEDDAKETALLLYGLAHQLMPVENAGHA